MISYKSNIEKFTTGCRLDCFWKAPRKHTMSMLLISDSINHVFVKRFFKFLFIEKNKTKTQNTSARVEYRVCVAENEEIPLNGKQHESDCVITIIIEVDLFLC